MDFRNAEASRDLAGLATLAQRRMKDILSRASDNLRETDTIHCGLLDWQQKHDALVNGTTK